MECHSISNTAALVRRRDGWKYSLRMWVPHAQFVYCKILGSDSSCRRTHIRIRMISHWVAPAVFKITTLVVSWRCTHEFPIANRVYWIEKLWCRESVRIGVFILKSYVWCYLLLSVLASVLRTSTIYVFRVSSANSKALLRMLLVPITNIVISV